MSHEVKFGGIPENDDGSGTRFPTEPWAGRAPTQAIIDAALQVAGTLPIKPVGMRFTVRDENGAIVAYSPYYAFGVTAKTASDLAASSDPKERMYAAAAARDGMKRVLVDASLTLYLRDGDVILPALDQRGRDGLATR